MPSIEGFPTKTKLIINLKTIIIPYSLRNKNTKVNLLISILNPLINSLSPSNKSNGARLVSMRERINQRTNQTTRISTSRPRFLLKEKELKKDKITRKVRIKATSKDRLCKMPRSLPNLENLLALLQPVIMTIYAPTPKKEKNISLEYFIYKIEPFQGISHLHITINKIRSKAGLMEKSTLCEDDTKCNCLKSNLTPSMTGWRIPLKVTLLGPKRIWLSPNNFRSNKVTKATPPKPKRMTIKEIVTHNNILTWQMLWI